MLTDALVVEEHLVDCEGNVVLRLELHDVADFLRGNFRNLDLLDDQLSTTDRDRTVRALQSRPGYRASDRLHNGRGVLDGAVCDGIWGKGCHPQRGQRVGPARLPDVDGLHTARPDVEAEDFRRLAEERHIKSLSPCWLCSIGRPPPGGPIISHLLHSGSYGPPAPRPWNALGQARGALAGPPTPVERACRRKIRDCGRVRPRFSDFGLSVSTAPTGRSNSERSRADV